MLDEIVERTKERIDLEKSIIPLDDLKREISYLEIDDEFSFKKALQEEDNMLPPSLLRKKLLEKLQTATIWQGLHQIYGGSKPYIASLAKCVFDASYEGDDAATAIIDESCQALALLLKNGVLLHGARPVAIASGGLFQHQTETMTALIGKYCDVELITNTLPPVYGACRKAVMAGGSINPDFSDNFEKTYGGTL